MLNHRYKTKEKYEYNKASKEALQDWKANYPESLKKDYVPTETNKKRVFNDGIKVKTNIDLLDDIFGKK